MSLTEQRASKFPPSLSAARQPWVSVFFFRVSVRFCSGQCWVLAVVRGCPVIAASQQGLTLVLVHRLLAAGASVPEHGLQALRLQWSGLAGSGAWAEPLWCPGFFAPQFVGSSQTRDQTCVRCIGRRILSHWSTREVGFFLLFVRVFLCLNFLGSNFMVLIKCGSF